METIGFTAYKLLSRFVGRMSDTSLYRLSTFLKFILLNVIGYRKEVVIQNLKKCFPDKSNEDIHQLTHQYYQNLCDLILEALAAHAWPLERVRSHIQFTNTEILNPFIEHNIKMLGLAAHMGNFELAAILIPKTIRAAIYAVYRPLANKKIDAGLSKQRSSTGLILVKPTQLRKTMDSMPSPSILILVADQNPSKIEKAVWVDFLNMETAFAQGPAELAMNYQLPIVYFDLKRISRGKYECECSVLVENASLVTKNEIIKKYAEKISQSLVQRPDDWLWSHKRWKWRKVDDKVERTIY